jgi:predicted nucleotidyltransferase
MTLENQIDEFVKRALEAAGANLESMILFGSAASGDYDPDFSNLNLFCVLRDASFTALQSLSSVAKWWDQQKQPPPLFMTRAELERSTDVFTIELLDMQRHHRVLFGEDVLLALTIPMHLHRVQVEYELREKLVLLRQQLVFSSESDKKLWGLLLRSVPSFVTLFRHAAIALGREAQNGKRHAVKSLSEALGFDLSAIEQVLDAREHKIDPKKIDVKKLAQRYLAAVEQVTLAVDKTMDSGTLGHS